MKESKKLENIVTVEEICENIKETVVHAIGVPKKKIVKQIIKKKK